MNKKEFLKEVRKLIKQELIEGKYIQIPLSAVSVAGLGVKKQRKFNDIIDKIDSNRLRVKKQADNFVLIFNPNDKKLVTILKNYFKHDKDFLSALKKGGVPYKDKLYQK